MQPEPWYEQKTLTNTDVTQKFTVPTHWQGKLVPQLTVPGSEKPLLVVDERGNEYTFRLTVRSESCISAQGKYYPKPEFQFKEWSTFVEEKKLKARETIYFWLDEKCISGGERVKVLRVKARVKPIKLNLLGPRRFLA